MPKPVRRFCIPYNRNLELESGWTPEQPNVRFAALRFHYALFRQPPTDPKVRYGEKLDVIAAGTGIKTGATYGTTYKVQVVDAVQNTASSLAESSIAANIASEISGQLGVAAGPNLAAKISSGLQATLKSQFSQSFQVTRTETFEQTVSFSSTFEFIGEEGKEDALVLPQYQMATYDLHLTHVDYLQVEYKREFLGLRKKRRKFPEFSAASPTRNLIAIMAPLASISSWKPLPSPAVKWPTEHYEKLDDPLEVSVGFPRWPVTPYVGPPERPSLYQLANAAFPTRWVKRKGDWTEEDLRAAELDEAKDTAWWFEYGKAAAA